MNFTDKCDCYRERIERHYFTDFDRGVHFAKTGSLATFEDSAVSFCTGTKEQEFCSCGGDRCKCDFYEGVRKKAENDVKNRLDQLELAFYRDYIFDNGLLYDAVNKYEIWKSEQEKKERQLKK